MVTGQREVRPVWNNVQRVNHQNKFTHPHPKRNFVPTAVTTKSGLGLVLVNAAKQSSPRAATSISIARHVNTDALKQKVKPTSYSYFKAHSPLRRPFNQKLAAKTNNFNKKVYTAKVNNVTTVGTSVVVSTAKGKRENAVKSSACWIWRPTGKVIDHISKDSGSYMPKRFDYVDPQGRLKHMTGNKSYLTDYQDINGGFVAFAGSPKGGKITGKGSGPDWLFDIDLLTNSMNYEPVTAGNQTNKNAGIKDNVDAVPTQQYILLPLLYDSPQSSKDTVADDAGKKTNEEPANEGERNGQEKERGASNKEDDQNVQDFRAALDNLLVQQKEGYANSTNNDNTVSPSVSAAGQSFTNADDLSTDPLMPDLEDTANLLNTGIFSGAYDDEDVGAEADLNNLETTMNVSPIPTTRIQKDHPKDQIIGDINSSTQTRRMTKISKELAMVEKALYGLHQAPRDWYETLSTYLLENRFKRGIIDNTLFIKKDKGDILLVQVYVDDIIFGSTKKSLCTEFESLMHKKFQMSSTGELTFFLGLQVMQRDDGIFIRQDKYVADIFKKFDFSSVKTASTLIETNKALLKDEEAEDADVHLYRSMIGSLMYLTASRLDIMFAICACARFQVTPKTSHLHAVKRIFRYLKGQPKLSLWYPRDSPFDLEAFSDSDYAGASLDRKSTT
ncbi:uncharacterized mitochondrial protein-like protein [Tanacetum coccineum]|uniref:Uncharacterized mitochondrial protein-like protein n=1 Tax=Tanacetum coccineum TaxID=301880 RepID=A0ABQ5F5W0_9ASTR